MTRAQVTILISAAAFLLLTAGVCAAAQNRPGSAIDTRSRIERFRAQGPTLTEETPTLTVVVPTEALAGFDNQTNGFDLQGADYPTLNSGNVVALRSYNDNRFAFEEMETVEEGLGPTFNGQSCSECHQNVVTGGSSQIAEHRTGRLTNGVFFESIGGSLIQSRATAPEIVEHVNFDDGIRSFRMSTNTLGDGYVEAIPNEILLAIRDHQPSYIRGTAVIAPVLEAGSAARVGRFGWKSQHASLQSFSADAYLNEMGITSPLFPEENTSSGVFVGFGTPYDPVAEPEDDGTDVMAFANFMRATKAPPRGAITGDVLAGEQLFRNVGCAGCHVASIRTARTGTVINGGAYTVPAALGNRLIHPYSDFLLHNIGTGDGIPVLPDPGYAMTAQQIRTAPLWGLRTRNRLMHDGLTFTLQDAISRHTVQADPSRRAYRALPASQQAQLLAFLSSL